MYFAPLLTRKRTTIRTSDTKSERKWMQEGTVTTTIGTNLGYVIMCVLLLWIEKKKNIKVIVGGGVILKRQYIIKCWNFSLKLENFTVAKSWCTFFNLKDSQPANNRLWKKMYIKKNRNIFMKVECWLSNSKLRTRILFYEHKNRVFLCKYPI